MGYDQRLVRWIQTLSMWIGSLSNAHRLGGNTERYVQFVTGSTPRLARLRMLAFRPVSVGETLNSFDCCVGR